MTATGAESSELFVSVRLFGPTWIPSLKAAAFGMFFMVKIFVVPLNYSI